MSEEGMQQTENKLIHIGMPIDIDETQFWNCIDELREQCYKEDKDIRKLINRIVPTYTYQKSNLKLIRQEIVRSHEKESISTVLG